MATMNAAGGIYDSKSFLRDTSYRSFYLDTSKLPKLTTSNGDYVIVPPECKYRMDLFSYQQYGSSRFWWIIALANADLIKDPIWDFISGLTVFVPRDSDLLEKLSGIN
jgi:hypothetical protein